MKRCAAGTYASLFKMPANGAALERMAVMCGVQDRFEERWTPRCLTQLTCGTMAPLSNTSVLAPGVCFPAISMCADLLALNLVLHVAAQESRERATWCRRQHGEGDSMVKVSSCSRHHTPRCRQQTDSWWPTPSLADPGNKSQTAEV